MWLARSATQQRYLRNVLARLAADDWYRTVVYNYPEIHERSLRWLAVHTVHDVQHHLLDIRARSMLSMVIRQMKPGVQLNELSDDLLAQLVSMHCPTLKFTK